MTETSAPDDHDEPDPHAVIGALLRASDLPEQHDAAALAEATGWREDPGIDDPTLLDLEGIAFVTVDNDGSRDLDQALHIEALGEDGRQGEDLGADGDGDARGWRIRYALADAAHYVRPGSALWASALARGASLYAPTRALPMLPETLSEDLVSLLPGVARRALVFDMHVGATGLVTRCDLQRARVRSRLQLTYAGVQRVVDGSAALEAARAAQPRALAATVEGVDREAVLASLAALAAVGEALEVAQRRRGVMPFDRSESEIGVVDDPPRFDVEPRQRLASERWNEQLSLACNMQGARLLEALVTDEPALCPIFRVHDAPGVRRLRDLEAVLQQLSKRLGLTGAWQRQRKPDTSLAEWFATLPRGAPRLKRAIQRQILRAQNASSYEPAADRHHALAADGYARFSSPMREIVGIHTHLVLLDALALQPLPALREAALREATIASANASRVRQKTLDRGVLFAVIASLLDADLERDGGAPWREGTLLGLDRHKLHVGLDGMALDVKVYREDMVELSGSEWTLDDVAATPVDDALEPLVLGDGVRLRAARFDAERQRYVLELRPLGNRPRLAVERRARTSATRRRRQPPAARRHTGRR